MVTPETSAGQTKNPLEIMMSLCQVSLYAGFDEHTHLFDSESFYIFCFNAHQTAEICHTQVWM